MSNGKHPVWDGTVLNEDTELNRRAQKVMTAFYLGQGFMEGPEWKDLGDDFRFGFRSIINAIDRGEIK